MLAVPTAIAHNGLTRPNVCLPLVGPWGYRPSVLGL